MLFEVGIDNRFCRFARSDSDSVNGSPPEAFGGLPLDLDSPSGYTLHEVVISSLPVSLC